MVRIGSVYRAHDPRTGRDVAIITHERVFGHALSNQEHVILDAMKQTIADRGGFVPVVLAELGERAGALGAVLAAHDAAGGVENPAI